MSPKLDIEAYVN